MKEKFAVTNDADCDEVHNGSLEIKVKVMNFQEIRYGYIFQKIQGVRKRFRVMTNKIQDPLNLQHFLLKTSLNRNKNKLSTHIFVSFFLPFCLRKIFFFYDTCSLWRPVKHYPVFSEP